eukprot:3113581-Pleurochrysis_carterae.AAC.1
MARAQAPPRRLEGGLPNARGAQQAPTGRAHVRGRPSARATPAPRESPKPGVGNALRAVAQAHVVS